MGNTRKVASKGLRLTKAIANKNAYTKKLAQKTRRALQLAIGQPGQRELYNLYEFYPAIGEYYSQTKDTRKGDPLISILLPTYNTPEVFLRECIESIIIQSYSNWELCIADDKSPDENVIKVIKEYQNKDKRIKLVQRPKNGHISEATNSALDIAKGEFIALMDHDDVLWPNALYEIVETIRNNKNVDFIYTDEDKIDGGGKIHSYPFLKPDFSPEFLESCNYITHFSCIRRSVMLQVGGFRKGYEGAQDWDLFIRVSEITQQIVHIPKLLYSWRIHEGSTASDTDAKPYVYEAQRKLLEDHLARTGRTGRVETGIITQHRTINYDLDTRTGVRVIIFFSGQETFLSLINSMQSHEAGVEYELLCVVPKMMTAAARETIAKTAGIKHEAVIEGNADAKYNVVEHLKDKALIFVEDTVIIKSDQWAKRLIADTQASKVGIVGPVLLTEDSHNVMSAGLGIGYGTGVANMLEGMPFDDPHYSRGLYAKSRRNVSAVSPLLFAISKEAAPLFLASGNDYIGSSLNLLQKGYRHVYTPYVQAITKNNVQFPTLLEKIPKDRYLNPNFDNGNSRMEVRSTI